MRIDRVLQRIFLSLFCILLSLAGSAKRYEINLSDSSRISLLTCSSGNELYSIFGHSAIRVSDPIRSLDIVFNYGTFDFYDPNFYPNFVRGHLNYILSVSPYREFKQSYVEEGRWIWEQRLNINLNEKQHLFDSLLINYRPENRYYPYDFFGDNCATRIRDIFVKRVSREITFDYSSFEKGKSFRQLLMPNLARSQWAKLGINLLLGLPADHHGNICTYPNICRLLFSTPRFYPIRLIYHLFNKRRFYWRESNFLIKKCGEHLCKYSLLYF